MFEKLRNRCGKQFVKKFQTPFGPLWQEDSGIYKSWIIGQLVGNMSLNIPDVTQFGIYPKKTELFTYGSENGGLGQTAVPATTLLERAEAATDAWTRREDESAEDFRARRSEYSRQDLRGMKKELRDARDGGDEDAKAALRALKAAQFKAGYGGTADGTVASAIGNFTDGNWKTGVTDLAVAGIKAADSAFMGDKNFGAQSEAIDTAVHGVSSKLMESGNPYAMAAGAALEGANFLTKAGGQTVQGFDVDINSSGYGQLGHMDSSSSRDFGAMIGLGGIFGQDKMKRKLAKRNAQAKMAMEAANIAEDQTFEQEARMNSIQNVIMNNQIALSGGLETNVLGG